MTWTSALEWVGNRTQWRGQMYELVEERGARNDRGRRGRVGWHLHLVHDNGNTDPEPITGLLGTDEQKARLMAELTVVDEFQRTGLVFEDGDPKWRGPDGAEWRQSDLLLGRHRIADEDAARDFERHASGVDDEYPEDFRDVDGGAE